MVIKMKENFLSKIKDFLPNKRGSVTIEFIFMLMLLTFIFAFFGRFCYCAVNTR